MRESVQLWVDEKGDLWVPAALQDRLRLEPGMTLLVEDGGNGGIRLRPEPEQPELVDKQGILVVRAEPVADLRDVVRRERELRLALRRPYGAAC